MKNKIIILVFIFFVISIESYTQTPVADPPGTSVTESPADSKLISAVFRLFHIQSLGVYAD